MNPPNLELSIVLYGSLAVFNFANLVLLRRLLNQDFSGLLFEKNPVVTTPAEGAEITPPELSYSRFTGFIGGTILAFFLWALGNIVIYLSLTSPAEVTTILESVGTYFLAGSALFAPYGFNQLRTVFNPSVST